MNDVRSAEHERCDSSTDSAIEIDASATHEYETQSATHNRNLSSACERKIRMTHCEGEDCKE
jgi:hypothetical protein